MMTLYPIKFTPQLIEKIWGGNKLSKKLGKNVDDTVKCGESWELSGVKGNESIVANGEYAGKSLPDIIEQFKGDLVGNKVYEQFGNEFPLLVKFIDANDDLSVQVHPDDILAKQRHNSFGKTEMWYIMDADTNASLICGFNQPISKDEYLKTFKKGKLMDVLNREPVLPGDVFFIPAGRIHTIGKGLLVAEIQQTSDVTYRIYDFDRVDDKGQQRELHIDESVDALDFEYQEEYKTMVPTKREERVSVVKSSYFTTNKIAATQPFVISNETNESFTILTFVSGDGAIEYDNQSYPYNFGDVYLIPAAINEISLIPHSSTEVLETQVD